MTLLDINHVDYCYNEGTSPTIHNISLTVCPNSTTVIIGLTLMTEDRKSVV